jgi:hypothetical protein
MPADALWNKFFTCYNQPPAGQRVQDIIDRLGDLGGQTALIGVGQAGPWCLMARAIQGGSGPTVADMSGHDIDSDTTYVADLYAPCLRGMGGIETAMALIPGSVYVHHAGGRSSLGEHDGQREKKFSTLDLPAKGIAEWVSTHSR